MKNAEYTFDVKIGYLIFGLKNAYYMAFLFVMSATMNNSKYVVSISLQEFILECLYKSVL